MLVVAIVGGVALAGFTGAAKGRLGEDKNMTILLSLVFLGMIGIVFSGFLDTSLQFAGTPDIRSEVAGAIRTAVGMACAIVFAFFIISVFVIAKDPYITQKFTSTMMYLSFLLSFISISVLTIRNSPNAS